jgi:hypothetical protein
METNKSWTLVVEEDKDTNELLITLPDDLLKAAEWQVGDTLEWIDNFDGTYTLVKKNV